MSNNTLHHISKENYPLAAVEPQHRHNKHSRNSTEDEPPQYTITRFLQDSHLQTRTPPDHVGSNRHKGQQGQHRTSGTGHRGGYTTHE